MEPIEWERSFEDSRGARLFGYVLFGSMMGLPVLFGAVLVAMLPLLVGTFLNDPATLALVALFALVGGPMSLLYLWPLLTDPEQREGIAVLSWGGDLSRTRLVVAAVLGAVAYVAALWAFELGPIPVLALGMLTGSLGATFFLSEGRIDPDARSLSIRQSHWSEASPTRTVDLDGWADLHRYRVGPVVVLRPSYARGSSGARPRLLTVPPWVADAAEPVFEAAIATPTPDPGRARESNPTVAATLVVFGVGLAGVGIAIGTLGVVPAGVAIWIASLFCVFGALFLFLAYREL